MAFFEDGRGGANANEAYPQPQQPQPPQAPQQPQAPQPKPTQQPTQPSTPLQDNPAFRALPRDVQRQVEAGALTLAQAQATAGKAAAGAGTGTQGPPRQEGGSPGGGSAPSPNATSRPRPTGASEQPTTANPFVNRGETVGEQVGTETFARPGTQAFQPFAGRVMAQNLRDPGEQVGLQMRRDIERAGGRGDLARAISFGAGGGGATLGDALGGNDRSKMDELVLKQMGLA